MKGRRDFIRRAGLAGLGVSAARFPIRGDFSDSGDLLGDLIDETPGKSGLDLDSRMDPWIEIDRASLVSNVNEIRRRVENRPIMAVVKCNAYGHGAVELAGALQSDSGIDTFMVVKHREALELRDAGITGTIMNMGPLSRSGAEELIARDITQAVYSRRVDWLADEAARAQKQARVHIMVDTGMRRVGVPYPEALAFIERVDSMPSIRIDGIFTDLTEDDEFNPVQVERFEAVCSDAAARGIDVGVRHAAATAEVDRYPFAWLDMVRPGSCVMGLEPERQNNMRINASMTFKTRVAYVKHLEEGDSLSYHRAYPIEKESIIATLPCGYSDGYPPEVANRAEILIRGRRFRTVGPITANHMMIDVTGAAEVQSGDEVVLWGAQGGERVSKVELEERSDGNTNTYRMATRAPTYLPRVLV